MAVFRWVVALVFLFVMALFGVQNMGAVTVKYYFGSIEMPVFLLMGILILLGAFLSAIIGVADQIRLQARIRNQERRINDLETEIASLRRVPRGKESEHAGGEASR